MAIYDKRNIIEIHDDKYAFFMGKGREVHSCLLEELNSTINSINRPPLSYL